MEGLSIVKVDKRPYRQIAQENWGLTNNQMEGMHVHHRIPLSMGGTNDAANLFVCSPSFHFHCWHGANARLNMIEQASINGSKGGQHHVKTGHIKALGKRTGAKAMAEGGWLWKNRVENGKRGGNRCKELGVGFHACDHSAKAKKLWAEGKGLAALTPEQKSANARKGGAVGGATNAKNKTGVCSIPPEEHSKRMARTNSQRWKCPSCGYVGNAKSVNAHMLKEHQLDKTYKQKCDTIIE